MSFINNLSVNQTVELSILSRTTNINSNNPELGVGIINTITKIPNNNNGLFNITIELLNFSFGDDSVVGHPVYVTIQTTPDSYVYKVPRSALKQFDEDGNALILIKENKNLDGIIKVFEILKMGRYYLYLIADENDNPIKIYTQT
ncbi:MAG: hypothetical protein HRT38_12260 [Alteromonadaceae bacterium]|nr:hypothetical protein [Alteromonadaceae bacterium]